MRGAAAAAAILLVSITAGLASGDGGKTCAAYDADGNELGRNATRAAGTFATRVTGYVRLDNLRATGHRPGTCDADHVEMRREEGGRVRFVATDKFDAGSREQCTFVVDVEPEEGCPSGTPTAVEVKFVRRRRAEFGRDGYTFQATFPVPAGTRLNDAPVTVSESDYTPRVGLAEDFDGVEVVPSEHGNRSFDVRTTRLLYLVRDVTLTLIATDDGPGGPTSEARLTLRMSNGSVLPTPEFEESFYDATVHASELSIGGRLYPAGLIKLREDYPGVKFELRPLNEDQLSFEAVRGSGTRDVDVRLTGMPDGNLTTRDVFLHLGARVSDDSLGLTSLYIRLIGQSNATDCGTVTYEPDNVNHLNIAVIVLSVIVVILLLVIIYLYFKYVCAKKPQPCAPCKKCSTPTVKVRRPTPRKISEFPYPLDNMPTPLETLEESEAEEEEVVDAGAGKKKAGVRIKIYPMDEGEAAPAPAPPAVVPNSRKRSITFRESDEESRQNRESVQAEVTVHQERKTSTGSQRRPSAEEERRRRKSSVKMYRCLT